MRMVISRGCRLAATVTTCALFGLAVSAQAQPIFQHKGVDARVDYASLTKLGPWDDRNYQLTTDDLTLLAPNEEELHYAIPAFYRVELRKTLPDLPRTGLSQYPLSASQLFKKKYGGYEIEGKRYASARRVEGRYEVSMTKEVPDLGQLPFNKTLDGEERVSTPPGQSETAVKIHPTDPDRVIAGSNDLVGRVQRMWFSNDGGENWNAAGALPNEAQTCCDPVVDWSARGEWAYAATLADAGQIWTYRSNDDGQTWIDRRTISTGGGNDKPFMHVDQFLGSPRVDNIYASWQRGNNLFFSRSTNNGLNWSAPLQISNGGNQQGVASDITTDRDGDVFYVWAATNGQRIMVRRSTNGGTTWAAPVTIANTNANFRFVIPAADQRPAPLVPSAATDLSGGPFRNTVYVTWVDSVGAPGGNPNNNHATVQVAFSRNNGATWTIRTPHPLVDIFGVDRFHPWIAVGPDGTVHLVFYDTRRDGTRRSVDLFYTFSENGGVNWSNAVRLTGQQSPRINEVNQLADYIGLDVVLNDLIAVHTDNRREGGGVGDSVDIYAQGIQGVSDCTFTPPGLQTWLPLDEAAGNVANNLGPGPNGTLINGPTRNDDLVIRSANFDGTNDYVRIPDGPTNEFGTGDFSIDAWVRTTDNTGTIAAKRQFTGNRWVGYLFLVWNNRLLLQLGDTTNSWQNFSSNAIPIVSDGGWHHVAVTLDRNSTSGGRMYVDGRLVFTFNPTGRQGNTNNSAEFRVGRDSAGTSYLRGDIDEVRLFNRTLSAEEIRLTFESGAAGACKPPTQPPQPTASINCFGNFQGSGQITCNAQVQGGTPPYNIQWTYSGTADSFFGSGNIGFAHFNPPGCGVGFDINFFQINVTDAAGQTTFGSLGPVNCF